MNLSEAKKLAVSLMGEHGLIQKGWSFTFDNAKRRFGVCRHMRKQIGLSMQLVSLNDISKVKDTILHEIAHALVGPKHGHDWVWRSKAIEIGCNGERCYDSREVVQPKGNYNAVCSGCGHTHVRFKKPTGRRSSCGKCSGGRFNEKYELIFKKVW